MSDSLGKTKFLELGKAIENIKIPLNEAVNIATQERANKVAEILSGLDPFAEFFYKWRNRKSIYLGGLHICRSIAGHLGKSAAGESLNTFDERFIDKVLSTYSEELTLALAYIDRMNSSENISYFPILSDTPQIFREYFSLGESMLYPGNDQVADEHTLKIQKTLENTPNDIVKVFEEGNTRIWMCYWDWDKDIQPDTMFTLPLRQSLKSVMPFWKIPMHITQVIPIFIELLKNTRDHGDGKSAFLIYQDAEQYIFTYREGGTGIFGSDYVKGLIREEGITGDDLVKRVFCSGQSSKPQNGVNYGMGLITLFNRRGYNPILFDGGKRVERIDDSGTLAVTETGHKCSGLLYFTRGTNR